MNKVIENVLMSLCVVLVFGGICTFVGGIIFDSQDGQGLNLAQQIGCFLTFIGIVGGWFVISLDEKEEEKEEKENNG